MRLKFKLKIKSIWLFVICIGLLGSSLVWAEGIKKISWPNSAKIAYINRCVSSMVSQGIPEQYARPYATCVANGMEKEFGMEEYNQMMNAEPNPNGSAYDRRLHKVFESCRHILPKY